MTTLNKMHSPDLSFLDWFATTNPTPQTKKEKTPYYSECKNGDCIFKDNCNSWVVNFDVKNFSVVDIARQFNWKIDLLSQYSDIAGEKNRIICELSNLLIKYKEILSINTSNDSLSKSFYDFSDHLFELANSPDKIRNYKFISWNLDVLKKSFLDNSLEEVKEFWVIKESTRTDLEICLNMILYSFKWY